MRMLTCISAWIFATGEHVHTLPLSHFLWMYGYKHKSLNILFTFTVCIPLQWVSTTVVPPEQHLKHNTDNKTTTTQLIVHVIDTYKYVYLVIIQGSSDMFDIHVLSLLRWCITYTKHLFIRPWCYFTMISMRVCPRKSHSITHLFFTNDFMAHWTQDLRALWKIDLCQISSLVK